MDPQRHIVCAMKAALGLIAGKPIKVSTSAYPCTSPTRTQRLRQLGSGVAGLLATTSHKRILVSGEQLAYRSGRIDYYEDNLFAYWRKFGNVTRPFFVVPGGEPENTIAAITGCDPNPLPQLHISDIHCTVVLIANWQGSPAIIHYGECEDAAADISKRAAGQELAFADGRYDAFLARMFAFRKMANGSAVMAQSRIAADPYEFSWKKLDTATELWLSRQNPSVDQGYYQIDSRLSDLRQFYPVYRDGLSPVMDALQEWCALAKLQADLSHGDFWLGNVLFKGNAPAGIIDWEWPRKDGLPLVDALYMLFNSVARKNGLTLLVYLRQLWADEVAEAEVAGRLAWMCTQSGLDRDGLKFVGLALWLEYLWTVGASGWVNLDLWFNDVFRLTLPVIHRWLDNRAGESRSQALPPATAKLGKA